LSDRKYFESLSEKTGFQKDILEKVYRLVSLLKGIQEDRFLRKTLVLKGGTAVNFLYFKLPRLSIDIDLNYVSPAPKEIMLMDRKDIDKSLTKLFRMRGYEIERATPYALLQYNLKYKNTAENTDRLKVEINFMERIPINRIIEKDFETFDIPKFNVRTYPIEELFATKFRALVTRAAPRDLYDVYMLINGDLEFDEKLLKKCFIFYVCLAEDFLKIECESVEAINPQEIKRFLLPLMEKRMRPDLNEMKTVVKEFVSKLLCLNENERTFIDLFYKKKRVDLNLLFEDVKYNPELKKHPMLAWKLK